MKMLKKKEREIKQTYRKCLHCVMEQSDLLNSVLGTEYRHGILAGAADSQVLYTGMATGTTVTLAPLDNGFGQEFLSLLPHQEGFCTRLPLCHPKEV